MDTMKSLKSLCFWVVVLGVCVACSNTRTAAGTGTDVRGTSATYCLVTYNVGVFDKSGTNTTGMIASMMKELVVQVIGVNELDSCNLRHPAFQLKDFAEAMGGWNYLFAPAIDYKGGKYGIGIAYDPQLTVVKKHAVILPKEDGAEQRAMAICVFDDFIFCSTHLDHRSKEAQLAQARFISAWASVNYGDSGKPIFLCGDLNAEPDSETIKLLQQDWTILSPLSFTYSAKNPVKCIDYIMIYKNAADRVKVLESGIPTEFNSGDVAVASDHLPVYMKIRIR